MSGSTPDPIHLIGPLALAVLDGSCPVEVLRDAVAETGWQLPSELIDTAIHFFWPGRAPVDDARPARAAAKTVAGILHVLYGDGPAPEAYWALDPIVRHWRECQATAALRAAPPDGAGTCYHETPR